MLADVHGREQQRMSPKVQNSQAKGPYADSPLESAVTTDEAIRMLRRIFQVKGQSDLKNQLLLI